MSEENIPNKIPIVPEKLAKEDWGTIFKVWSATIAPFIIGGVILIFLGAIATFSSEALVRDYNEEMSKYILEKNSNQIITYWVSWALLILISIAAFSQIKEIIEYRKEDKLRKKANQIAIIIALVMTIFLFKQPYLNELFGESDVNTIVQILLFGSATAAGWFAWFLKQVKKYGEFFHVFLLTIIIGFCWYARLTAPETVQLVAVAFLLGSLLRIAKDYLDQAEEIS